VLRETAIHFEGLRSLGEQQRMAGLAARVTGAFDCQLTTERFDLDETKKVNVHIVDSGLASQWEMTTSASTPSEPGRIAAYVAFAALREFGQEGVEEDVGRLFKTYASALVRLAQESGWDVARFEAAIQRARESGIKARLVREAVNRRWGLRGSLTGAVEADGIRMRLVIEELGSSAVLASAERATIGDYWELINTAHKLSWNGQSLCLSSNHKSSLDPFRWCLAPANTR
jgi:hypothetical protein